MLTELEAMSSEEFVTRFRTEGAPAIGVQPLAREFLSMSGCKTLNDVISRARGHEIDLHPLGKGKAEQNQTAMAQAERPMTQDSCLGGQQGRDCCAKCERTHVGGC